MLHPELFEKRALLIEALAKAGLDWMTDYSSVDLLHEEYGLEIMGIRSTGHVKPILQVLRQCFPTWKYTHRYLRDAGRDVGWQVVIHKLPESKSADAWKQEPVKLTKSTGTHGHRCNGAVPIKARDQGGIVLEEHAWIDKHFGSYRQAHRQVVQDGDRWLHVCEVVMATDERKTVSFDITSFVQA